MGLQEYCETKRCARKTDVTPCMHLSDSLLISEMLCLMTWHADHHMLQTIRNPEDSEEFLSCNNQSNFKNQWFIIVDSYKFLFH